MKNYEEFKQHVIECYPQEACGYLVDDTFIPIQNVSNDPADSFEMSVEDSKMFADQDYAVIHSHTMKQHDFDFRTPSHADMIAQRNCEMPFGIVHCDGENVSDILWFGGDTPIPDLINRQYIPNVQDCFTLARDYYRLNYNIDFGTHPRPANWYEWNPHYIEHHFKDLGLIQIRPENLKVGDILLFNIASNYASHIGIVTGEDKFIHHLLNRTSAEDKISKWHRQFNKALRHKDLC